MSDTRCFGKGIVDGMVMSMQVVFVICDRFELHNVHGRGLHGIQGWKICDASSIHGHRVGKEAVTPQMYANVSGPHEEDAYLTLSVEQRKELTSFDLQWKSSLTRSQIPG